MTRTYKKSASYPTPPTTPTTTATPTTAVCGSGWIGVTATASTASPPRWSDASWELAKKVASWG